MCKGIQEESFGKSMSESIMKCRIVVEYVPVIYIARPRMNSLVVVTPPSRFGHHRG